MTSRSHPIPISIVKLFWNCVQGTRVTLPCEGIHKGRRVLDVISSVTSLDLSHKPSHNAQFPPPPPPPTHTHTQCTVCVHISVTKWFIVSYCLLHCGICEMDSASATRTWIVTLLTYWGLVTHICVSKLTIIGSDNGLSPDLHQAIIWTNAGLLLIGPLGTNFGEILIEILTFSFKKMSLKVSSAKRLPFCLGLNVLSVKNHEANDEHTTHSKKYARCLRLVAFHCGLIPVDFTHILQDYFTKILTCQWSSLRILVIRIH